ncbi:hypothetical protein [Enterobacter roggenkampii]|uniref:hypothetical protein n=1 Tax=Enterobacter roggenkampii TaxID=1812935 RepID=UPI0022E72F2B|nr:hypothetical protein [Enterobacter roggenkampii]
MGPTREEELRIMGGYLINEQHFEGTSVALRQYADGLKTGEILEGSKMYHTTPQYKINRLYEDICELADNAKDDFPRRKDIALVLCKHVTWSDERKKIPIPYHVYDQHQIAIEAIIKAEGTMKRKKENIKILLDESLKYSHPPFFFNR